MLLLDFFSDNGKKKKNNTFNVRLHILCVYTKDIFPFFVRKEKRKVYKNEKTICGIL